MREDDFLFNGNVSPPIIPISSQDCVDGFINNVPGYIKVISAVTCVLSVIGSIFIVLSYLCYKELRNKAREVIVHISLMDLMSSMANLIGIAVNFDAFLYVNPAAAPPTDHENYNTINNLCIAQAGFAMYGTLASILWTMAISVYFYISIMMEPSRKLIKKVVLGFYVVCYGVPLVMLIWFAATGKIGYSPVAGSGWCSLIVESVDNTVKGGKIVKDNFNLIFGSSLWIYMSFILIPLITISLLIYLKFKVEKDDMSVKSRSRVFLVEIKLISIPIIFILLRMWSMILTVITVRADIKSCPLILFLLVMGGIGDSAQGFCNSLIFCFLNVKVRNAYLKTLKKLANICKRQKNEELNQSLIYSSPTIEVPSNNNNDDNTSQTFIC